MIDWPLERDMAAFYGNPRGRNAKASPAWERENIVNMKPPFTMYYDGKPITSIRVHRKIADALMAALTQISHEHTPQELTKSGIRNYCGSYCYRTKRTSNNLSCHAYGAAIDFNASSNAMGNSHGGFKNWPKIIAAFEAQGAVWGGTFSNPDPMHFQFAKVRKRSDKSG